MTEYVTVGTADEVAEGTARSYSVGGEEVAVARVAGELLAFSDICTHRGCNLANGGEIDGTAIECECHGSVFDMKTGEVIEGPATEPVAVFAAREENGDLQVGV
jgi:3-phenylpropionate/trans-cinnamate dioxygenase ferredoxin subunit